ncbi:hypothetical protein APS_0303 [Acetobacter pasteurianus subsp. pasteurianus LMG 1262 = NBRC 106471]|uniref:Uncharacterized protein n=1 Tax=Acetobacter pasteurianus TaxID=438 RepID=A0A1A0DCQ4_ACEPA|nr:hypothetical protein [Acetobacter pasteurianus]OAZ72626.1 hypothetical protein SRCM100623_01168 [Acetobacter pasteurianus]GAB29701.1 hypothetical protein APS_0303 [Acetobacter pasteurianus subsp. pasteurianus LMG 1262 = NBRC 106471]GCD49115.1 hypothetical protein NBRC106471_0671 [Acetobacter pasteurianus subsp. pasteurianus LMG 1262 = NBRC 106471]
MSDIDPKELKILSDILALVLEDQPGQSTTALEALRNRAKRNATTGGALKNLFQTIAEDPEKAKPARASKTRTSSRASANKGQADMSDTYRAQLQELRNNIVSMDRKLRTATAQNETLKSELYLTLQARAEMQAQMAQIQSFGQYQRRMTIVIATIAGLLAGIAGTQLFHAFFPPHINTAAENARYLY